MVQAYRWAGKIPSFERRHVIATLERSHRSRRRSYTRPGYLETTMPSQRPPFPAGLQYDQGDRTVAQSPEQRGCKAAAARGRQVTENSYARHTRGRRVASTAMYGTIHQDSASNSPRTALDRKQHLAASRREDSVSIPSCHSRTRHQSERAR